METATEAHLLPDILSIQERQTINRLTQKTISSLLVPLGQKVLLSNPELDLYASTVRQLVDMVDGTPDEGHHGVTLITAQLRSASGLPIVFCHGILLGWSQEYGPDMFADVRKRVLRILEEVLSPAESLSALGSARNIVVAHNNRLRDTVRSKLRQMTARVTLIDEAGENRAMAEALKAGWPDYVSRTINVLMGKQVVRKGGVAALITNVSGTMMTKQEGGYRSASSRYVAPRR